MFEKTGKNKNLDYNPSWAAAAIAPKKLVKADQSFSEVFPMEVKTICEFFL